MILSVKIFTLFHFGMRSFLLGFMLLLSIFAVAQNMTQSRKISITPHSVKITLDTLPIFPQSVVIRSNGQTTSPHSYQLHTLTSIIIVDTSLLSQPLEISYRVILPDLGLPVFNKQHSNYLSTDSALRNIPKAVYRTQNIQRNPTLPTKSPTLDYSGNLMRGFMVGQDGKTALNSALHLQISGELKENLWLTASVSDQNLPLSPQGNTASLNEFDKIFINLKTPHWYLEGGDIVAENKHSFFSNYSRKVLGIGGGGKVDGFKAFINAGVSKGKFTRNKITAIENNSGPYRLSGENGQPYIVILSGSEKVFIDGVLLQRGYDKDYVIDYQTAEIKFMAGISITRFSRITVEFEYTERSYGRYVVMANSSFQIHKKVSLYTDIFMENDLKSQPTDQNLTDENRYFLSTLGNQTWLATGSTAQKVKYNAQEILYKQRDTTVMTETYTIFYYAENDTTPDLYRVSFVFTGENKGNYVLAKNAVNGQTYQWVAPKNKVPQGNYDPQRTIITPKVKQLYTIGTNITLDSLSKLNVELSLSNNDQNTFSTLNNNENVGFGGKLNLTKHFTMNRRHSIISQTDILLHTYNFNTPERFLPLEFFREWAMTDLLNQSFQHYRQSVKYLFNKKFDVVIGGAYLQVSDSKGTFIPEQKISQTAGYQYWVKSNFDFSWIQISGAWYDTQIKSLIRQGQYRKADVVLDFNRFKFLNYSLSGEYEERVVMWNGDSLQSDSRSFWRAGLLIKNKDTTLFSTQLKTTMTIDNIAWNNLLTPYSKSVEAKWNSRLLQRYFTIGFQTTYRYLNVNPDIQTTITPSHYFSGRINTNFFLLKRSLVLSANYELANVSTPQFSYTYIDVGPGQGIYTWIDYNENGIKELGEFEVSKFEDEARYIRLQLPTNQYQSSYLNNGGITLNFILSQLFTRTEGYQKILSLFSLSSSITSETKTAKVNFNPFLYKAIDDTTLLEQQTSFVNLLNFISPSRKVNASAGFRLNSSKNQLVNGVEGTQGTIYSLSVRYLPISQLQIYTETEYRYQKNFSQYFTQRNYLLKTFQTNNGLEYPLGTFVKNRTEYRYNYHNATLQSAKTHRIGNLLTVNITRSSAVPVEFNYVFNTYVGEPNAVLGYQMLEGLGVGSNYIWRIGYRQLFRSGIEVNVQYNGRKIPNLSIQHSGNIEMRIHF